MRIRIHKGHGTHHPKAKTPHTPKHHPKKGTHHTGHGSGSSSKMSASEIVSVLENDPHALSQFVQDVASALFSSGFAAEIIAAIEAVTGSGIQAGLLLAGTVSTLAGALQLNGSSQPVIAMVFLNGAATASACYVPTHIRANLATGQDVYCEPINGDMSNLQIHSIRNLF